MKALILNSGIGSRMGDITKTHPKCMTEISNNETILSRQLTLLKECDIKNIIITTGYLDTVLMDYVTSLNLNLDIKYVKNNKYQETNAIYSIYVARDYLHDDIIMMHGDLVFTKEVLEKLIKNKNNVMTTSSTTPLPEKDFKAVIKDNYIEKIGVEFFDNAVTCQPLYKVLKNDWEYWLNSIISFCENDIVKCYAENAYNEVSDKCKIYPLDIKDQLCNEIDNQDDLEIVSQKLKQYKLNKTLD